MLTLLAFQVAAAITNARTHRNERGTLADPEALVENSPVGVVVPAPDGPSCNREARRIVKSMRTPGRPAEPLLEVIVVRLANGRRVFLHWSRRLAR